MTIREVLGFHAGDGIFFKRMDDDTVMVTVPGGVSFKIAPSVWASVVSSVSGRGETHERWQQALDFHKGINDSQP